MTCGDRFANTAKTLSAALRTSRRAAAVKKKLAGLAVRPVAAAPRAELLQFQPVGIVPAVLLGDVVPLFALDARHGDLGADIGGLAGHGGASFTVDAGRYRVAEAGLEPTTQRL